MMHKISVGFLAVLAISLASLAQAHEENCLADVIRTIQLRKRGDEGSFSYNGATGPEEWPGLCQTGQQQSPINIVGDSILAPTPPLQFRWSEVVYNVTYLNTGETLKATLPPNDQSHVIKNGIRYDLIQFHFHNPSEHRFEGFNGALEVHFVHASAQGGLLVVGILLDPNTGSKSLTRNTPSFYSEFTDLLMDPVTLPKEKGDSIVLGDLGDPESSPVKLGAVRRMIGPTANKFHAYTGSLTTPPCTEGVRWHVFKSIVYIPVKSLFAVQRILPHTARDTQPWYGRLDEPEPTFGGTK
ncbi:alpha carbonic anhydrase [Cladochytrium replicatum]|nr:alpha carbonic anhydrase [Cladochytrium replicatum]